MRRLLLFSVGALIVVGGVAHAGAVCVNGHCTNVFGVQANVVVSQTGVVKIEGGVTGGPGIKTTGVDSLVVKPDNIAVYPRVNGASFGRVGVTTDYGNQIVRVYLGPQGCTQFDQNNAVGPCISPTP